MLREVSRHKNIEQITMVEIDAGVVEFCRQYLPNHSAGAYDDPRFKLVIDDGVNFVNQTTENSMSSFLTVPILSVLAKACLPLYFMRDAPVA